MVDTIGCRNSLFLDCRDVHGQLASVTSSDSEDAELAAVGVCPSAVGAEDDSHLVTLDDSVHLSTSSSSCPRRLSLHFAFLSLLFSCTLWSTKTRPCVDQCRPNCS